MTDKTYPVFPMEEIETIGTTKVRVDLLPLTLKYWIIWNETKKTASYIQLKLVIKSRSGTLYYNQWIITAFDEGRIVWTDYIWGVKEVPTQTSEHNSSAQQKELDELKRVVELLKERLEQTAERTHALEDRHHSTQPVHWSWKW